MQIRDLEIQTGLDRATIRYYEKEGLIDPQRKDNGYREYSDDILAQLQKIKLLRQLGMSLDMIKSIQQGSADFNQALSIQIQNLENVMDAATNAKEVCTELYQKNISYASLDAGYYLEILSRQRLETNIDTIQEEIERPYHPVLRFLARMTDYVLLDAILTFFIVVVLRIRPYSGILSALITMITPFLMVPIASLMIHKWGTTPGKWIYGIWILSEDGCNLSFAEAQEREKRVLAEGYGYGIPALSFWRLIKCYKEYREFDLDWDLFCDIQFKGWETNQRHIAITVSFVMVLAINIITITDMIKPKYRGDITVSDFAANYNYYYKLTTGQLAESEMLSDGTWYPEQKGQVTIDLTGKSEQPNKNFEFQTDGTTVRSIHYENKWTEVGMLHPITYRCQVAAITAVMSQKGMDFNDLLEFSKMMDSADLFHDGSVSYGNITISWNIDTDNCSLISGWFYTAEDETKPSQVSVIYDIVIQQ